MPFLFDSPTPLHGQALGTVIHLGAGSGEVLDRYATLHWQRLILLEGDPDTVQDLRAAVGGRADVEVLAQAVAPAPGTLRWHRYNLRGLNGPEDASDFVAVYPRLREVETVALAAVGVAALLAAHVPALGGPHLLVIDLPGQETALLEAIGGELLRRFGWIAVRSRRERQVDDAAPAMLSLQLLERNGFRRVALEFGDADPLWQVSLMRFDADAYRIGELQDQLASVSASRDALAEELGRQREAATDAVRRLGEAQAARHDLGRQLDVERAVREQAVQDVQTLRERLAEADRQAAARQSELEALGQTCDAEREAALERARVDIGRLRDAHAAELDGVRRRLEEEQAAFAAGQTEMQRKLHVERETVARLKAELEASAQALEGERAAHTRTRADLQRQVEAATEATRQHQDRLAQMAKDRQLSDSRFAERIKTLEDEMHASRQAAALSLKLQTLREADLKDLQSRYQVTLAQQQSQHELLTKLAQRLTLANRYFRELSSAQQLPDATPTAGADAPAPRKRRPRTKPATPSP